jgi:hypothetical protein
MKLSYDICKMKKNNLIIIALFISTIVQSQSSSTTIQYKKSMQPALSLELANSPEDVQATILKKLKQEGYKPATEGHLFWKDSKTDGFYVFNNILLTSMGTQKLDMYFKVAQKNTEEKDNSRLYLLVSTGNENFSSPEKDSTLWNRAKTFLDGFTGNTMAYSLEQDIMKQENILAASQKKLSALQKDEKALSDKIQKNQEDLSNNKSSQVTQALDIEDQKKSLENLKLKRKG